VDGLVFEPVGEYLAHVFGVLADRLRIGVVECSLGGGSPALVVLFFGEDELHYLDV